MTEGWGGGRGGYGERKASAIEARRAETQGGSVTDESAVPERQTPEPSSIAPVQDDIEWRETPVGPTKVTRVFLPVQDDDAELRARYDELIFAVSMKHEGESRHETALRYIREREAERYCEPGKPVSQGKLEAPNER